jgi:hypothetical protein
MQRAGLELGAIGEAQTPPSGPIQNTSRLSLCRERAARPPGGASREGSLQGRQRRKFLRPEPSLENRGFTFPCRERLPGELPP